MRIKNKIPFNFFFKLRLWYGGDGGGTVVAVGWDGVAGRSGSKAMNATAARYVSFGSNVNSERIRVASTLDLTARWFLRLE
jgi:hypothetical protein